MDMTMCAVTKGPSDPARTFAGRGGAGHGDAVRDDGVRITRGVRIT